MVIIRFCDDLFDKKNKGGRGEEEYARKMEISSIAAFFILRTVYIINYIAKYTTAILY